MRHFLPTKYSTTAMSRYIVSRVLPRGAASPFPCTALRCPRDVAPDVVVSGRSPLSRRPECPPDDWAVCLRMISVCIYICI